MRQNKILFTVSEEHDEQRSEERKFVSPDLPRPSLAEGDSYSGGGVKISAADVSTTTARLRQ